jgi:pullulanase
MNTLVTKPDVTMATQKNSTLTPGFAFFSDSIRDALRGSNSNTSKPGFINGAGGFTGDIKAGFMGAPGWCKSPTQTVNYASCHDGYTLFDRITLATPDASVADRIKMNNLAAAVVLTSQGTPFIHAGEEMLRSKPLEDGSGFEHNSYKSADAVNNLKWNNLNNAEYQQVFEYYKGLISFRKAHPALRMTDAQLVKDSIKPIGGLEFNVCAYQIQPVNGEESEGLVVIFNPRAAATTVELPEGEWTIYVQGDKAGTEPLGTASGTVTVDAISTCVLVKEKAAEPETTVPATTTAPTTQPNADTYIPTGIHPGVILCVAVGVIAMAAAIILLLKKKK